MTIVGWVWFLGFARNNRSLCTVVQKKKKNCTPKLSDRSVMYSCWVGRHGCWKIKTSFRQMRRMKWIERLFSIRRVGIENWAQFRMIGSCEM